MIDIDKYERMFKATYHSKTYQCDTFLAHGLSLLAEVKRLREWKKLVSDIVQQQDGSHLREMLKEMIE